MNSRYDHEADILYLRFAETEIVESEEVSPGVVLDFDAEGRIVGVEFQKAEAHLARGMDLEALKVA
jgi:uncharacterized protein YuzE